jgi:hypothetical protein
MAFCMMADGRQSSVGTKKESTMALSFLSLSTMPGLRFFAVTAALLISAAAVKGEQRSVLAFQSRTTHGNPRLLSGMQEKRPSAFTSPSYHASYTHRSMMPDILVEASTWISESAAAAVPVSPEPIHTAFTVATFLPQPFWLLIVLLPNKGFTKKIMGGLGTFVCMYDVCKSVQPLVSYEQL